MRKEHYRMLSRLVVLFNDGWIELYHLLKNSLQLTDFLVIRVFELMRGIYRGT